MVVAIPSLVSSRGGGRAESRRWHCRGRDPVWSMVVVQSCRGVVVRWGRHRGRVHGGALEHHGMEEGEREGNRQLTQPTLLHLALAVAHRNHCHCRFRLFSCSCPPSSHLHCGLLHTTEWASGRPPPGLMWAVTMPPTQPPKNPKQWPENPTQWPEAIIRGLRHSEGRYRGTGGRRRSGPFSSPLTPRPPPPPPPPSAHRTTTSFMATSLSRVIRCL